MSRRKQRSRAAVQLPKGVHKVTARGHEYYYYQAGRGTSVQGPRIKIQHEPDTPEFWSALREAQGKSNVPTVNTVNLTVDEYLSAVAPTISISTYDHYQRSLGIAKREWGNL